MRLSLRTTLLLGYGFVVALMGIFAIFTGLSFISETVVNEAKLRVQMDLNAAWMAFSEERALLQAAISIIAQREDIHTALRNHRNRPADNNLLVTLKAEHQPDFLILIDNNGIIIHSKNRASMNNKALIKHALRGRSSSGTSLFTSKELISIDEELAQSARITLVPTERARPTDRSVEDRGLAMVAAIPVFGPGNKISGVVYGGILLNRKFSLVDRIRETVFDVDYYKGKPLGTVTIFLWDTRVATNVIKEDSTRAIGTRVSDEVYTKVLEKGERFGDRAFVVNDWYLSAYDPIFNADQEIIGILYVGLLEQKYSDYKSELTLKFLGMGLLAMLVAIQFAFFFAGRIKRPVDHLKEATRKLSGGALDTRVREDEGSQDIRELGHSFNLMAASLELRNQELEKATREINEAYQKADEKNRAYLEMLGFVTHELKSPLASIVFAIESLRDRILGPINKPQEELLRSSAKSAHYLNTTIANFLNLSRIEEGALKLKLEKMNPCESMCKHAVQRLSELIADNDMKIDCTIPKDLIITGDVSLLSSVFQNLISNAVKYGDKGSIIRLAGEENEREFIFSIYNDGIGFSAEESDSLFTKFSRLTSERYDTKSGTGLGLFVTKMIITRHGGRVWAESKKDKWAKFYFTIPKDSLKP